ncbi:MAG TPA: hydantoinase/carbamoylase family amidase [Solirubrobacteraceae bacterium]|nr:hydantoinase/carbamoylase family amidase [Solirubrobacteraceae bacterium]
MTTRPPSAAPGAASVGIDRSMQPSAPLPPIDADRLWASLRAAARIGSWRSPGVQRLALTDADREMRDTFCAWCRESGLEVRVDRVGNIFARRAGAEPLEPVVIGSHLDTQVAGGRYDGALGVLAGLEILRWLQDNRITTRRPVEVASFTNEEGARFGPAMLGSGVFAGAVDLERALDQRDEAGVRFGDELRRIGYDGAEAVPGRPPRAYLELHIEQDDVLDRAGVDLGIVTGAYPARAVEIRLRGETGHAGATPMRRRRDALAGAAEVIAVVEALGTGTLGGGAAAAGTLRIGAPEAGTLGGGAAEAGTLGARAARAGALSAPRATPRGAAAGRCIDEPRATVTRLEVWPNRPGIIPGEAVLTVDYRHAGERELERMGAELTEAAERVAARRGLQIATRTLWEFGAGIRFDSQLARIASEWAARLAVETLRMRSTAGHDAYWMATIAPALILFVPCVDGVTHNEHEEIELHRVLRGVNVLAATALEVANEPPGRTTAAEEENK